MKCTKLTKYNINLESQSAHRILCSSLYSMFNVRRLKFDVVCGSAALCPSRSLWLNKQSYSAIDLCKLIDITVH